MRFSTFGRKKSLHKSIGSHIARENAQTTAALRRKALNRRLTKTFFYIVFCLFLILTLLSLSIFGNDNYYTVKRNESLDDIARRFGVSRQLILNSNDILENPELEEGMQIFIPNSYDLYTVKEGDTFSDIAEENGIKLVDLLEYINKNTPRRYTVFSELKSGDTLRIPRMLSYIKIKSSKIQGLNPFRVEFYILTDTRGKIKSYNWDFGDGHYSAKKAPVHTFSRNGLYYVRLEVVDENNRQLVSNVLQINVRSLSRLDFTKNQFFELNTGDIIDLDARPVDDLGEPFPFDFPVTINGSPRLIEQIGTTDTFRINHASRFHYTSLEVECYGYLHKGNYFISPVASFHLTNPETDFYRSQYGTGMQNNSGPASVAMAITWATGRDTNVSTIRRFIGYPYRSGDVDFSHLLKVLNRYRVTVQYGDIDNAEDLRSILDQGHLCIINFLTEKISPVAADPREDLFGRYYSTNEDHYVVIKGYSLDGEYFICYDPMPADWENNAIRYADNVSHLGRNRYYAADELITALKMPNVLEVFKSE